MIVYCPKCDRDITDTHEDEDPSVGIVGGWYCDACDIGVTDWEMDQNNELRLADDQLKAEIDALRLVEAAGWRGEKSGP